MIDLWIVDAELSGCFLGCRSEETTAGFRGRSFSNSGNRSSGCRSRSSNDDDVGLGSSRPGLGSGCGGIGRLVREKERVEKKRRRRRRRRLRKKKIEKRSCCCCLARKSKNERRQTDSAALPVNQTGSADHSRHSRQQPGSLASRRASQKP